MQMQNVAFIDKNAGVGDTRGTYSDDVRDIGFNQDVNLQNVFSRPVKIHKQDWVVGNGFYFKLNPWKLFWEDPVNFERIKYFMNLRCTLKVKFIVNGNAFYFGRAIASYNPMGSLDQLSSNRSWVDADLVQASQKPHIFLNPTLSQGGELELPFFYPRNALSIPEKEWDSMGEVTVHAMQPLGHVNSGDQAVTVSVFAWAENVKFAIPTQTAPANPVSTLNGRLLGIPEADEYGTGPISKPATTVARWANMLTMIPPIAPFARATEIGAKAAAGIASIFGYSKTLKLTSSTYNPQLRTSLATTNVEDETQKLTVDIKQELTLDPCTTGIQADDELTITGIASRESYLTNFGWAQGDSEETLLFSTAVDPGLFVTYSPGGEPTEYHLPACAFAALPFKYWRGTMKFRFQIVSSEYHKGRIKIVYDPYAAAQTSAYNTAYTTIFDISEQKDFSFDVAMSQPDVYRQHLLLTDTGFMKSDGTTPALPDPACNGTLSVYVVNELTTAGPINPANDIEINVFVSCPDLEVACPEPTNMEYLRVSHGVAGPARIGFPEAGQEGSDDVEEDSPPTNPASINSVGGVNHDTPNANKLFFGEVIGSFRQLLKRYYFHEKIFVRATATEKVDLHRISRNILPAFPGYTQATSNPTMSYSLAKGSYYYANVTLINYLMHAYAGVRGGVRWMYDFKNIKSLGNISMSRDNTIYIGSAINTYSKPLSATTFLGHSLQRTRDDTGHGAIIVDPHINSIGSVEIPWYSHRRFYPTRYKDDFKVGMGPEAVNVAFYSESQEPTYIDTYCAAAEDFNLFFFVGAPIFYFETEVPTS